MLPKDLEKIQTKSIEKNRKKTDLRARVVELSRLADRESAGADDENLEKYFIDTVTSPSPNLLLLLHRVVHLELELRVDQLVYTEKEAVSTPFLQYFMKKVRKQH